MTFEFLCAGLKFETSDLVTFWLSGGQLLRPSGLVYADVSVQISVDCYLTATVRNKVGFIGLFVDFESFLKQTLL